MKADTLDLGDVPLFEGIDPRDREDLLGCLKAVSRSFGAGQFILFGQEEGHRVGVVLSGMVHMIKEDQTGHRTLLSYLEPGDLFGPSFALRYEERSYVSFCAASDTRILFLSLEHLIEPCKNNCAFHRRLQANAVRLLGQAQLRLVEKIEVCTRNSLREKILAYLTLLANRQGQKYISVPLSRTEMAAYLQSNRSAMTRELSAMRAEGLIDFDGNTFVLKG